MDVRIRGTQCSHLRASRRRSWRLLLQPRRGESSRRRPGANDVQPSVLFREYAGREARWMDRLREPAIVGGDPGRLRRAIPPNRRCPSASEGNARTLSDRAVLPLYRRQFISRLPRRYSSPTLAASAGRGANYRQHHGRRSRHPLTRGRPAPPLLKAAGYGGVDDPSNLTRCSLFAVREFAVRSWDLEAGSWKLEIVLLSSPLLLLISWYEMQREGEPSWDKSRFAVRGSKLETGSWKLGTGNYLILTSASHRR